MIVAFDTETHLIRPGMLAPKLVCGSFADDIGGNKLRDPRATLGVLHLAFGTPALTLVGHNIAYDLAVCAAEDPSLLPLIFQAYEDGRIKDTEVRQKLIDIAKGEREFRYVRLPDGSGKRVKSYTNLAELVKIHLGRHLEKKDTYRLRYHELDGVPLKQWPEEARTYALEDAKATLEVFEAQDLAAPGGIPNEAEQTRAAWALHLMSMWGVRTDPARVAKLLSELRAKVVEGQGRLAGRGFYRENGTRDMKAIKAAVESAWPASAGEIPRTPTGGISTSADTLRTTTDEGLHVLAEVLEAADMLSDWGGTIERGTKVPICARYDVLKETGRTGCSGPNMQNPPARNGAVRECFIPRPGFLFAACDYDTLELRAWAQVCLDLLGYSTMAEALREGRDLHVAMGAQLLGVSYEEALTRVKAGDPEAKQARQLAKAANFGFPGGMGAEKFALTTSKRGIELTVDGAERLRNAWFAQWREAREYFALVSRLVQGHGGKIEQVRSGRIRGDVRFTSAANGFFQSLASDGAKEAIWRVTRECFVEPSSPLYGSRLVMFLHDELILECPEACAHEAAARLAKVMIAGMSKWIPDVPITAKPVLMRAWYKGAEPVYVEGRLVPSRLEGKVWVADVDKQFD